MTGRDKRWQKRDEKQKTRRLRGFLRVCSTAAGARQLATHSGRLTKHSAGSTGKRDENRSARTHGTGHERARCTPIKVQRWTLGNRSDPCCLSESRSVVDAARGLVP